MPTETQQLNTSLGHSITAFTNDHVGDKIARNGLYEKENLTLLLQLLKKITTPVVLDIGANIGNHALAFSTVANKVLAFEPLPAVYALLDRNVTQNNITNIQTFPFALSDVEEDATIFMVSEGNVGASSFDKRNDNVEAVTVSKKIGDKVFQESGLKKLDMVKIDVEAHEVYVLRGLMQTLQQHKPIITMEWNDPLTIERLNGSDELQFLFEQYNVYVLGSNYDRGYWARHSFAFIRRKLTRLFKPREARLYAFNPARLYKNLLLIPKSKQAILDGIL
ncbi:MAG: FkbM family methyltransferase [Gammaproteobacteria bacterium]|nr:FkbM family methyltransferase [Gammaproteobacteria bacterium]